MAVKIIDMKFGSRQCLYQSTVSVSVSVSVESVGSAFISRQC